MTATNYILVDRVASLRGRQIMGRYETIASAHGALGGSTIYCVARAEAIDADADWVPAHVRRVGVRRDGSTYTIGG